MSRKKAMKYRKKAANKLTSKWQDIVFTKAYPKRGKIWQKRHKPRDKGSSVKDDLTPEQIAEIEGRYN